MTLDEEKSKIRLEHRLETRRIILDKLLFGLVFVGLGLLGSYALDSYKAREAARQFFLEQRYNAVKETSIAFSGFTQAFFDMTVDVCKSGGATNEQRNNVRTKLPNVVRTLNNSQVLFDESYIQGVDSVVNLFSGMIADGYVLTCDHLIFADAISLYFDNINVAALESPPEFGEMQYKDAFKPNYHEPRTLSAMGTVEYATREFNRFMRDSR